MLKLAICDNNMMICELLEDYFQQYGNIKAVELETDIFYSGDNLLQNLRKNYYDLLLMDISLDGRDSMRIGRMLREELHNYRTQVIFTSTKPRCPMDLFQVHPIDFLVKPINKKVLFHDLDLMVKLTGIHAMLFTYKIGRTVKKCNYQDIMYFERAGRKTDIVFCDCRESFYASLKELANRVTDGRFFFCHESFLVNFDNVKEFQPNKLIMVNDDILDISQGRRSTVKKLKEKGWHKC